MNRKIRSSIFNAGRLVLVLLLFVLQVGCSQSNSQSQQDKSELDKRVENFLNDHQRSWRDMNVPAQDGRILYNLIIENNYTSALEIGTSTGHSTIWIAWAMSKTGGKVTTIEIDEGRHNEALENLKAVGLLEYVDARLANAHQLVKELNGPFDFVFSDADKEWYTQYFKDVDPKLKVGGCFTAHNVKNRFGGTRDFVDYVEGLNNYETTISGSSSGVSISYKKSN